MQTSFLAGKLNMEKEKILENKGKDICATEAEAAACKIASALI